MATYKKMPAKNVQFLVVHAAATKPSMDIGLAEIRKWHLQRGFAREGYHFIIRRDGTVEEGRPTDMPGAHVQNYNGRSIGICMAGGVTEQNVKVAENNYTEEQFSALHALLKRLRPQFPTAKIVGHRDLAKGKDCPSFDVAEWLRANPL